MLIADVEDPPENLTPCPSSKRSQIKEKDFRRNTSSKGTGLHERETYIPSFHKGPSNEKTCLSNDRVLPTTNTGEKIAIKKQDVSASRRLAERVILISEKIKTGKGQFVSVYKPPMYETMGLDGKMIVRKHLNVKLDRKQGEQKEKVLLMVGATGAGKRTLINAMFNYIMGVEWKDEFRFKIVTEEDNSQANSVTRGITAYTIHPMEGSAIPYVFTVIDTPGFGDTEGLSRDIFITDQIKEFFSIKPPNGIDHLDGIGFVTQSSLPQLTPTQKYIFDSIFSIFGKDVKNSFFMMISFSNGKNPPVLEAIEQAQISYDSFFKFNNSALFASNANDDGSDEMSWNMGNKFFNNFFAKFSATNSVSLQLTNQVLQEREQLETLGKDLCLQIEKVRGIFVEIGKMKRTLEQLEVQTEQNREFEWVFPVTRERRIDLRGTGKHTLICSRCNFTCHNDCADGIEKKGCVSMDADGNCKVCAGKCPWHSHWRVPYKIEFTTVMEKRTCEDLIRKYSSSGKVEVLSKLEKVLYDLRIKVLSDMYRVRESLHRLDEIAFKPNPLTEVQYIELLIATEKREGRAGFEDRIEAFEEIKSKAKLFEKIQSKDDVSKVLDELIPMEERRSTSIHRRHQNVVCAIQ